ncbi:MAG: hypothetical protein Fur0022_43730 [Anaerolineales bacterium]
MKLNKLLKSSILLFLIVSGVIWYSYFYRVASQGVAIQDVVNHDDFSKNVIMHDIPEGMSGQRGIGFVRSEDINIPPFNRPQTEEFILAIGESFSPYLIIVNNTETPMPVLVSAILNYTQVEFALDSKLGLLHSLVIPAKTEINLPLDVSIHGTGFHDFFIVAFSEPGYHPTSKNERYATGRLSAFGKRTVIKIGDNTGLARDISVDFIGSPIIPHPGAAIVDLAFVNTAKNDSSHPAYHQFSIANVSKGEPFKFQVLVENTEIERSVPIAVMLFLDFHQVPILEKDVIVTLLDIGQEVVVNASVDLPAEEGIHEMQIIYIFDPYKSILHDEVAYPFVFDSLRVGLIAR